jgi:phospholipase D1/2
MSYRIVVPIGVLLVLLVAAWSFVPIPDLDAATLARYRATLTAMPLAPVIVVVLYVLLGLVAAPGTLLIGATFVCFGTSRGLVYAYAGMLANACTVHAIVRFGARDAVARWLSRDADSRIAGLQRLVKRRGILAVVAMRLTPMPYTIQNVIAGVADVRVVDLVIGTIIGLVPVMALMAGITSQFDAWLDDPTSTRAFVVAGVVVAVLLLAWAVRRWRQGGESSADSD